MNDHIVTARARLSGDALPPPPPASPAEEAGAPLAILAITAGTGNGWQFSETVLRGSLGLWEGVECFVDHAAGGKARSVRDLAGVLGEARWDPSSGGIRCALRPAGPAAEILTRLGQAVLAGPLPAPRVGFSADLVFSAEGRQVRQILNVLSVDLVVYPARGGRFVSGDARSHGPGARTKLSQTETNKETTMEDNAEIVQERMQETPRDEVDQARAVREALCGHLLESGLAAARLPQPAAERVRRAFAGRVFDPSELDAAIADARALVAELTGAALVQGARPAGRIHGMLSSADQITAAMHDLLGAARPRELAQAHPARLSGVRELYTLMTGDLDFTGGYHAEHAMFSVTTDLPSLLMNVLNKRVAEEWDELGRSGYRWWEPIVAVEHFSSLQPITGVLVGEVTVLPEVSEGDAYSALAVTDSSETGTWGKYGGYIGLTLEMFERDETHKLRQYPRKLASAALRRISALVGTVFTASSGSGPAMSDGSNVFAEEHGNLGSTALSAAAWEAASAAIYNQEMLVPTTATAPVLALDARYLVVPRGLRLAARQILYPSFEREATIISENMQRGEPGDVITCPEFSDANDWAAVADPRLAPAIILGERFGVRPEIFIADGPTAGALFTNDEIRMKVRHWVSVFVADYRPLYKAVVANG